MWWTGGYDGGDDDAIVWKLENQLFYCGCDMCMNIVLDNASAPGLAFATAA